LTSDILFNIFNRAYSVIINIIFIPLYIKFLGIDYFGLIAFYTTLLGSLSLLDIGLSHTLSRELALRSVNNTPHKETRDLIFSVELINWTISFLIGVSIFASSDLISLHWIHSQKIPIEVLKHVVLIMGMVIVFQWPSGLYLGALIGLEKQKISNIINILYLTFRSVGVIVILNIKPSIEAYFFWQGLTTFIFTVFLRIFTWKYLPSFITRPKFSLVELKKIWKFAAGIAGMSLIAFFITQFDKILVSKLVNLEQFGYYNLAFTVGGSLSIIVNSITSIIYPKLTKIVTRGDQSEIKDYFHKISKWMSIVSAPLGLFILFFSEEILYIWTKNEILAKQVAPMLRIVSLGTLFNCAMIMPYHLLLSFGNTKYDIYQNVMTIFLSVPLLFLLTNLLGAFGATLVWLFVNFLYLFTYCPLAINKYLKGEFFSWFFKDFLYPILVSLIFISIIKLFLITCSIPINIVILFLILCSFLILFSISIEESRKFICNRIVKMTF